MARQRGPNSNINAFATGVNAPKADFAQFNNLFAHNLDAGQHRRGIAVDGRQTNQQLIGDRHAKLANVHRRCSGLGLEILDYCLLLQCDVKLCATIR